MVSFIINPIWRAFLLRMLSNYTVDMSDLVAVLDSASTPEEFLTLLSRCYSSCSNNPQLLLELARKCHHLSLIQQAELICQRALLLQPNHPVIKEYQRHLLHQMVNRWHFLMLNDVQRNSSYFKAILKAVRDLEPRDGAGPVVVLDIGSGTGILR